MFTRGVTVHKNDGSVHILIVKSCFKKLSVCFIREKQCIFFPNSEQ